MDIIKLKDTDARIEFENGLSLMVDRVLLLDPRTSARTSDKPKSQLSVLINTEDMDTDHYEGVPEIQVLLNDATLYDCEPGDKGRDYGRLNKED